MAQYDKKGREIPDSRPVEMPLNFRRPLSLNEQIQRMIREQLSQAADQQGFETFEESDDFDVDEEEEPESPHELTYAQEEFGLKDLDQEVLDHPERKRGEVIGSENDERQDGKRGSEGDSNVDMGGNVDPPSGSARVDSSDGSPSIQRERRSKKAGAGKASG